jgi:hypothetical protein
MYHMTHRLVATCNSVYPRNNNTTFDESVVSMYLAITLKVVGNILEMIGITE